jgi:hypothetical protein
MARESKKRRVAAELRAIWVIRDVELMFAGAAITLEELCSSAGVSRATGHKVITSQPVKRLMAVLVFRILNARTGDHRSENTHVVRID